MTPEPDLLELARRASHGVWFTDHAREVCAAEGPAIIVIAETNSLADLPTEEAEANAANPSRIIREQTEKDELRLAICGGEDAPGYNASLSHETILKVLADNYQSWRRDAELAWDGETATSWKSRAQTAEADCSRLREALERAPIVSKYCMKDGFDEARFFNDYDAWKASVRQALQSTEAEQ